MRVVRTSGKVCRIRCTCGHAVRFGNRLGGTFLRSSLIHKVTVEWPHETLENLQPVID